MSTTVGFSASYILGTVHVRIAMALECETNSETYDAIKQLKADLDREIGQLYYPSPNAPTE